MNDTDRRTNSPFLSYDGGRCETPPTPEQEADLAADYASWKLRYGQRIGDDLRAEVLKVLEPFASAVAKRDFGVAWHGGPIPLERYIHGSDVFAAAELHAKISSILASSPTILSYLEPGWNSHNAPAIDERAIVVAEAIQGTPGTVVPRSNGGVQIEWHVAGVDVEISIGPDGSIEECGCGNQAAAKRTESTERR